MTENEAKAILISLKEDNNWGGDIPEVFDIAIQALEEVEQCRAIGTINEFKTLKEKSVAKKAIRLDDNDEYYDYQCPSCGAKEKFCLRHRYCSCGQLLEY